MPPPGFWASASCVHNRAPAETRPRYSVRFISVSKKTHGRTSHTASAGCRYEHERSQAPNFSDLSQVLSPVRCDGIRSGFQGRERNAGEQVRRARVRDGQHGGAPFWRYEPTLRFAGDQASVADLRLLCGGAPLARYDAPAAGLRPPNTANSNTFR
jgi:hypothetical protein